MEDAFITFCLDLDIIFKQFFPNEMNGKPMRFPQNTPWVLLPFCMAEFEYHSPILQVIIGIAGLHFYSKLQYFCSGHHSMLSQKW